MAGTPVVFVHGLWLHASSWQPWVTRFRAAGYEPVAPGWPGEPDTLEDARAKPEAVAGKGVDDVVAHYTGIIQALDTKPVVIGHSFGGLVVQRLLAAGTAASAVAIDAVAPRGVLRLPLSALRVASVALRNPLGRNKALSLTPAQFRYGFGNAVSAEESAQLHEQWTMPSPARPVFEAATANLAGSPTPTTVDTDRSDRGPLLLVAGGLDHTVPASVTRATRKLYGRSNAITDYREFPDRGHSLTVDHGWAEVADACLDWLGGHRQ